MVNITERFQIKLAQYVGRARALGWNTNIPSYYVRELVYCFQQSSVQHADLRNIPKPGIISPPVTKDGQPEISLLITPFTLSISGAEGDHWDGIIHEMVQVITFNTHFMCQN